MSNRVYLEFDGFDKVISRLNKLGGDIKGTTEKALKKTHSIVTQKAEEAITPHNKTRQTEKSLRKKQKLNGQER